MFKTNKFNKLKCKTLKQFKIDIFKILNKIYHKI